VTQRLQDVKPVIAGGSNPSCCFISRREEHAAYHLLHPRRHVQPDEAAKRPHSRECCRRTSRNQGRARPCPRGAPGRPAAMATGTAKPWPPSRRPEGEGETPRSWRVKQQPPALRGLPIRWETPSTAGRGTPCTQQAAAPPAPAGSGTPCTQQAAAPPAPSGPSCTSGSQQAAAPPAPSGPPPPPGYA